MNSANSGKRKTKLTNSGATDWLREFAAAGATHLALRFIGKHEKQMELVARMRAELN